MKKTIPQPLPIWRGVFTLFLLWSSFSSPCREGLGESLYAQTQTGKASFYAKRATGSRTANGERLHHDSLTCAHLKYPFGTLLKVTNMVNGKQVVVRVNDRGPYRRGRIIDLSWGAAKAIGMIAQGIAPVTVEKVSEMTVPFRPDEDGVDLPNLEFELADIDPTGIIPIWQQEVNIDTKAVQRSMHQTVSKSAQEVKEQEKAPVPAVKKQKQEPTDVLDKINQNPTGAKAYQKRQGKRN